MISSVCKIIFAMVNYFTVLTLIVIYQEIFIFYVFTLFLYKRLAKNNANPVTLILDKIESYFLTFFILLLKVAMQNKQF